MSSKDKTFLVKAAVDPETHPERDETMMDEMRNSPKWDEHTLIYT